MIVVDHQNITQIREGLRKECRSCGLYLNQMPVFDKVKQSDVFWVGLSAVKFDENDERVPLSPSTRTGALIKEIESPFLGELDFYKTNLVKCVPLNNGKIRYPIGIEMKKCFPFFQNELVNQKPKIVFLLGKQVASFILKEMLNKEAVLDDQFNYQVYEVNNTYYIPVHHPSFILVYKRRYMQEYITKIKTMIKFLIIAKLQY